MDPGTTLAGNWHPSPRRTAVPHAPGLVIVTRQASQKGTAGGGPMASPAHFVGRNLLIEVTTS